MILTDDLGRKIELKRPAQRVVSLAPAIAENLYAIKADGVLIGVSTADDYPAAVQKLPRVGDFGQPSAERIRALRPDMAIVEIASVDRNVVENAQQRLQVPIFVQISRRYDDVARHLTQLGQITGSERGVGPMIQKLEQAKATAARLAGKGSRPTVFVEVSRSPLWTAGPGSFIDDVIRLAGGVNAVKSGRPFLAYSKEALLAANPGHYIIAVGGDMSAADKADKTLPAPLDRLAAVKQGHIHAISSDLLFRPTPRLADGLLALAHALRGLTQWD